MFTAEYILFILKCTYEFSIKYKLKHWFMYINIIGDFSRNQWK